MEIALKTIWKPAQPTELELMSAQDFDYFISFKKNPGVQTGTFATVSINIWSLKISEDYKGKTWSCEISGNSIIKQPFFNRRYCRAIKYTITHK